MVPSLPKCTRPKLLEKEATQEATMITEDPTRAVMWRLSREDLHDRLQREGPALNFVIRQPFFAPTFADAGDFDIALNGSVGFAAQDAAGLVLHLCVLASHNAPLTNEARLETLAAAVVSALEDEYEGSPQQTRMSSTQFKKVLDAAWDKCCGREKTK